MGPLHPTTALLQIPIAESPAMPPTAISLEELSDYFHLPEKQVAQQMGMCLTSLKKICRGHGITRWPFRKLKSLERTMQKVNADSSSISAQLGKSGAEAVRSANSSVDSSRAASPTMKIDCSDTALMQPPMRRAPTSNKHNPLTPGTPKSISSPKAESAVQRSSQSSQAVCDSAWPSFTISGTSMQQLVITNWSSLWTIQNLDQYVVRPLGVLRMTISEDGSKSYLDFSSSLAALQARRVCEEACEILRSRQRTGTNLNTEVSDQAYHQLSRFAMHEQADPTSLGAMQAPTHPQTNLSASSFLVSDSAQMGSSKTLSSGGIPHDEDEGGAWMLPLMPGAAGAPISSTQRWVSALLSPPQSCGSGSGSSSTSTHNEAESWMSPCLVSC